MKVEWATVYTCRQMAKSVVQLVMLMSLDKKSASIRMAVGVHTEVDRFTAYFYVRPSLL